MTPAESSVEGVAEVGPETLNAMQLRLLVEGTACVRGACVVHLVDRHSIILLQARVLVAGRIATPRAFQTYECGIGAGACCSVVSRGPRCSGSSIDKT